MWTTMQDTLQGGTSSPSGASSEEHLVRHVALGQREERLQVRVHHLRLLDATHHRGVHRLLRLHPRRLQLRLLILAREELIVLLRLRLLRAREEGVVHLADINTLDVDRSRGADAVGLVDSPQRHAIQLVRAGDQQQARRQLLQEHDALAAEAAAKQDQHAAGLMLFLSLAIPRDAASRPLGAFGLMSSAGYHLGAFSAGTSRVLPFLAPPISFLTMLAS